MNSNDAAFIRAMKANVGLTSPKTGRPKGAKDKVRRKNSRYLWSHDDICNKFTRRFRIERTHPTMILTNDCWLWTGASSRGFGYMVIGSRQDNGGKSPRIQAHRLSYQLHITEIPKGDLVGQKCGKKLCVNPAHLYLWRR